MLQMDQCDTLDVAWLDCMVGQCGFTEIIGSLVNGQHCILKIFLPAKSAPSSEAPLVNFVPHARHPYQSPKDQDHLPSSILVLLLEFPMHFCNTSRS